VARKRDTSPEALLQRVIADLEHDRLATQRRAVLALLAEGPLLCSDALHREIQQPNPDLMTWRAELLQFLRTLVRVDGQEPTQAQIGTYGFLTFDGHHAGGRVDVAAGGRDVRDLVVLQLVLLLREVGLRNVRKCGIGDCRHLFVKTYRREFCSIRCQQRDYKRKLRQRAREQKELQARRQQRRRTTKGTA
jgi:hypothetical protein